MRSVALAAACAAILPSLCDAAQWTMVPQVSLGADTDTNRRLSLDPEDSQSGVLGGSLLITRATEISQFALAPRATISRYWGGGDSSDALDSNDWGVNTYWRRHGERFLWDAQAGIADDSTLVTELGETGLVEDNTRRRSNSASVSLSQYVSARHMFQYQMSFSDVDYQQIKGTGLIGYRYPSAALMYVYSLSPRLEALLNLNESRLEAPDAGIENETRGAQLGMRLQLSERFDLEARAGQSQTRAFGRSDSRRSFFSSLSWHDELSRLEFSLSRDVEPSGRGVLENADDLRLQYSRNLSEKLSFNGSARLSRREDLDFALRHNDYRYGAATLALALKLDENWIAGLSASYSAQKYQLSTGEAAGYRVGLTLAWRPPQ